MSKGFEVAPEEIDVFAKNLETIADEMTVSAGVLQGVNLGPLVFGGVGQFFAIAAIGKIADAQSTLERYGQAIEDGRENVKRTAADYRENENNNAKSLKG